MQALVITLLLLICHGGGALQHDSCVGRCGDGIDRALPCQCNTACVRYDDCCQDYAAACQGSSSATITDDEIINLGDRLWEADAQLRFPSQQLRINLAATEEDRFFEYVNESRLLEPSYSLFVSLLDNYNPVTKQPEPSFTNQEQREVDSFLNHVLSSQVMRELMDFLRSKDKISSVEDMRALLYDIWFDFYARSSSSSHIVDSSGFEHVFVGEKKSSTVTGFHNWVQMYLLERAGHLIYTGANSVAEPDLADVSLRWDGLRKSRASMFIGTPPEFDMALYTLCFVARPGKSCQTSIAGNTVRVQTYDVSHEPGLQVASAFPMIN